MDRGEAPRDLEGIINEGRRGYRSLSPKCRLGWLGSCDGGYFSSKESNYIGYEKACGRVSLDLSMNDACSDREGS